MMIGMRVGMGWDGWALFGGLGVKVGTRLGVR